MTLALKAINIGKPIAWMLDQATGLQVLGVTYEFTLTGERISVWYTENSAAPKEFRTVDRLE